VKPDQVARWLFSAQESLSWEQFRTVSLSKNNYIRHPEEMNDECAHVRFLS